MVLSARDRGAIDATVRIRKLVTVRERMLQFCLCAGVAAGHPDCPVHPN